MDQVNNGVNGTREDGVQDGLENLEANIRTDRLQESEWSIKRMMQEELSKVEIQQLMKLLGSVTRKHQGKKKSQHLSYFYQLTKILKAGEYEADDW